MGHDERIAALTRKIKQRPADARLYVLRAEVYRHLGRYDRALRDLAVVERLEPGNESLPCERALTLSAMGPNRKKGTEDFSRSAADCLAVDPTRTDVLVARARHAEALGDVEAALHDWHAAWTLRAAPDLASGYALALERSGRVNEALEVLRDAAVRLEGATSIHRLGVELALRHGEVVDALAHADALVGAAPRVPEFHLMQARIRLKAGMPEHARRSLDAAASAVSPQGPRPSALRLASIVRVSFASGDDAALREAAAQLTTLAGGDATRLVGDLALLAPLRQLAAPLRPPSGVPTEDGLRLENTPSEGSSP